AAGRPSISTRTTGDQRFSIAVTHCISPAAGSHTSCCQSFLRRKLSQNNKWEESVLRRIAAVAVAVACLFALVAHTEAQQYPIRTVTIIVPYPAGGAADEAARVGWNFFSKKLGPRFIVEERNRGKHGHRHQPPGKGGARRLHAVAAQLADRGERYPIEEFTL